jgi:hypothetical protein
VAEPINLNKARKAKQRADKQTVAAANRVKHGRTKAEKLADKTEAERTAHKLDQNKREP